MQLSDFKRGTIFYCGAFRWLCTDVGTRVVVAIKLENGRDPSWYAGPPYAVSESVFDEYDFKSCSLRPIMN